MTVGVYGVVAAIIKMDDLGMALTRRPRAFTQRLGHWILAFAPKFMKFLSIAGTIAMFLVGGGIVAVDSEANRLLLDRETAWMTEPTPASFAEGILRVAGDEMDDAIVNYARQKYNKFTILWPW